MDRLNTSLDSVRVWSMSNLKSVVQVEQRTKGVDPPDESQLDDISSFEAVVVEPE